MKVLTKHIDGMLIGDGLKIAQHKAKNKDNVIIIVSALNGCAWFSKKDNKIRKMSRKEAKMFLANKSKNEKHL